MTTPPPPQQPPSQQDVAAGTAAVLATAATVQAAAATSGDFLRGNGTNVSMSVIQAADLPTGTASVKGALQLDGTASDIQATGVTAAAGSTGKAADAGHVHVGLALLGTTGLSGFALQNATPTIFTWSVPNDGAMHRVLLVGEQVVTSSETGGGITLTITDPGSVVRGRAIFNGGSGTGFTSVPGGAFYTVAPNTTVTFAQTSALTGGAATLYVEMWGS